MKAVQRKWIADYGFITVEVFVTYKVDLSRKVSFHVRIPEYVKAPIEEVLHRARDQGLQTHRQSGTWIIIGSDVENGKTARNEISRIHTLLRPIRKAGKAHEEAWESRVTELIELPDYIEESYATYEEVTNGPEEKTV